MDERFAGLTGNERLSLIGKFDLFYDAVAKRNAVLMESILQEIEIGDKAIDIMFKRHQIRRPKPTKRN